MALAEAWSAGIPGLVQGRCDVLDGLARRAGGALAYRDAAEFDAALGLLAGDPALRAELGRSGRSHVREQFAWESVMGRYESLLDEVIDRVGPSDSSSIRR